MSDSDSNLSSSNVTEIFSLQRFFWGFFQPEGCSYLAWQNLLKSLLWFLGKDQAHVTRKYKNAQKKIRRQLTREKEMGALIDELQAREEKTVVGATSSLDITQEEPLQLELITFLKKFLERKNICQCIEKDIIDLRDQDDIVYSKQSIILAALSLFLLRLGSGNQYDEISHSSDKYSMANIAKFIDAPEDRTPTIKTIETFLKTQDKKNINQLMIDFFKGLIESKFFQQHPQIMVGDFFLLAADCVHTHTYDHPHHLDREGNHDCPHCLKRVYNKGTEKETVRWLHCTLVYTVVFLGKLKIPLYHYPIHAKQVLNCESASEDVHKQECELVALKVTLPNIREVFPRTKIVLLLDGLYANRPTIRLLNAFQFGYIIVRKERCLTTLAEDCEGLSMLENHKKNQTKILKCVIKKWSIKHKYEWFNFLDITDREGELKTHVLRLWETREKIIKGKLRSERYHCEWLFSWSLSAKSCQQAARLARLRWEEEDLFNTCKNRGYKFKHDYSRHPLSFFNWHGLALLSFGIFEVFRFSEAVKQTGDITCIGLASKLRAQLCERPTRELFSEQLNSKKVQFRYNFIIEPIVYVQGDEDDFDWEGTG